MNGPATDYAASSMSDTITVRNLWHRPLVDESRHVFTYSAKPLLEYSGVRVFHNVAGSIDYVLGAATIGQRGSKFNANAFREIIDELLTAPETMNESVRQHIITHHEIHKRNQPTAGGAEKPSGDEPPTGPDGRRSPASEGSEARAQAA